MAVTAHTPPYAVQQMLEKAINLASDTFKAILLVNPISTWGATQEAYKFISDFTGAYTEVSSGGYARVTLAGLTCTISGENVTWNATSPISFGSSITLSAAAMIIADTSIGAGSDAATPVVQAIDFGQTVSSTSSNWTYTISGSGLLVATAS